MNNEVKSILATLLAFDTTSDMFAASRLGILFGSSVAAVSGYLLLRKASGNRQDKECNRVSS